MGIKSNETMKNQISISDFNFQFAGHGHYRVTYNGKTVTTSNMPLIDATKNSDKPKKKDLITLRNLVNN